MNESIVNAAEQYREKVIEAVRRAFDIPIHDAEDLWQEAVLRVSRQDEKKIRNLPGLLFWKMDRLWRNALRKRREALPEELPERAARPEIDLDHELDQILQEYAWSLLNDMDRELLRLRVSGYRFKEIAEKLRQRPGTLRTRLHEIRKKCRPFFRNAA